MIDFSKYAAGSDIERLQSVLDFAARSPGEKVKAGASGSLKSLVQFNHEKSRTKSIRFDLNPPSIMRSKSRLSMKGQDVELDYDLASLPLYMVGQIDRFF
ncbi:MAG: hypothetical protein HOI15_11935 [Opitutales bacterium]|nr:hypothetical protein [Opitutales bacterium]